MISVRDCRVSYGGRAVLDGFTFEFKAGGRYELNGPSGCGKTTLFRVLAGLIVPEAGAVIGLDKVKIACMFQEDRLFERLTAVQNVCFARKRDEERAAEILFKLGFDKNDQNKKTGEIGRAHV